MTELGVDYSFSRPDPAAIRSAGYSFAVRYVAPSSEAGKALSAAEAAALHAAGVKILLVFEDGAQNALGGANQGAIDGQVAKSAAAALGYPQSCPIFAAVDFDAQPDQIPTIDAYFSAFAAAIAPWPAGTYGDENVGQSEQSLDYWETEAWDGTSVSGQAAIYQRVKPTVANPVPGTDEDVLLKPITMWGPAGQPAPAPPQPASPPAAQVPPYPGYPLTVGATGAAVVEWQTRMKARGWDLGRSTQSKYGQVDGSFGPKCAQLCHDFEVDQHLTVDAGVVGPQVWHATWANPITKS